MFLLGYILIKYCAPCNGLAPTRTQRHLWLTLPLSLEWSESSHFGLVSPFSTTRDKDLIRWTASECADRPFVNRVYGQWANNALKENPHSNYFGAWVPRRDVTGMTEQ